VLPGKALTSWTSAQATATWATADSPSPDNSEGSFLGDTIDLKLLVIAAEEGDRNLPAIAGVRKRLGTRFHVSSYGRSSYRGRLYLGMKPKSYPSTM
jgi:hypothetical protein